MINFIKRLVVESQMVNKSDEATNVKSREKQTAAKDIGGNLPFMLVMIYFGWGLINTDSNLILVLETPIMAALGLTPTEFGYIVSVGFAASFVVSLFLGPLGDRFGRRFVLQLTLLGTGVFSVFQYFITSFLSWFGIRIPAGAFTGGEWGAGATALSESVNKKYRGLVLSIMQSGWVFGYGLASVIALFVITVYGSANGWRYAFLFAFMPALLIIVLRTKMKDPERFRHLKEVQAAKRKGDKKALEELLSVHDVNVEKISRSSYKQLFSKDLIRMTIILAFWNFITTGIAITTNSFQPLYFEVARGFNFSAVTTMFAVVSFAGIFGYILNGFLNDRIGAKYSIIIFALFEVLGILFLTYFTGSSMTKLYIFYIIFFFAENGQFSGLIRMNTETFPTRVRVTGAVWGGAFWSLGQAVWPTLFGLSLAFFKGPSFTAVFNQSWLWLEVVPEFIAILVFFIVMKNVPPRKELEEIAV